MSIELSEQQVSDMNECEEMSEQGKDKECFGCSLNKCILDLRYSSKAAAAPEMYEALKEMYDYMSDHFKGSNFRPMLARAKAAIAKAEGK